MAVLDRTSTLDPIREKVAAGERLDLEDGLALMESDDILGLGELADLARRVRGGTDDVFFVNNLYLNHTNDLPREVQVLRLRPHVEAGRGVPLGHRTSSSRTRNDPVRSTQDFTEIHMVGGEHPGLDLSYYNPTLTAALRKGLPDVHLKPFTASDIHFLPSSPGRRPGGPPRTREAGLGSLPGGGAEILPRASGRSWHRARSTRSLAPRRTGSRNEVGVELRQLHDARPPHRARRREVSTHMLPASGSSRTRRAAS